MDTSAFVSCIQSAGFVLKVEGDTLFVSPPSRLTEPQRQFIKDHKPAILAALTGKTPPQAGTAPASGTLWWRFRLIRSDGTDHGELDFASGATVAEAEGIVAELHPCCRIEPLERYQQKTKSGQKPNLKKKRHASMPTPWNKSGPATP